MARQRVAIPFGGGLDRYTGPMVVDRTAQEDVRNVHLVDGWAHVRRGAVTVNTLPGDVVGGAQLRAEDVLILVVYNTNTREVHVYRAPANGVGSVAHIGKWFDLHEAADTPPRVFLAEVAGFMFMAHDEPIFSRRAPTVYYDRITGKLAPLTAPWAHEDGIRFRGVAAHLGVYLAGWGYGTVTEFRPDLVRMSLPDDPRQFELKYFEPIGQRGEAVLRCLSLPHTLLCFTRSQLWEHFGGDRSTFGSRPIDLNFGVEASRLAIEVDGTVYFWSRLGPRRTTGGLSEDLSLPLDLRGPSPADLVAEGATAYGFATYYPDEEEVLWVFGKRVYAFSLRTERWRYDELPWEPVAAILSQPGFDVDLGYEPGFAVSLRVTGDVADGTHRKVTVEWTNESMIGDETLELWVDDGSGWNLVDSEAVEPQPIQDYTFEGLKAGTTHKFQIRARRGTLYREEYQSSNPDDWPTESLLVYVTGLAAPTITAATWERTSASSERILVTVSPVYNDVDLELLSGGVVVGTAPAPHSGPVTIAHVDPAGEHLHTYTARHRTAAKVGDESTPMSRWSGPDTPTLTEIIPQGICVYTVRWASASESLYTEIEDDYPNSSFALRRTADPGEDEIQVAHGQQLEDCAGLGGEMIPVGVRIRHRQDAFDVSDYSQYAVDVTSLELCDACSFIGGS